MSNVLTQLLTKRATGALATATGARIARTAALASLALSASLHATSITHTAFLADDGAPGVGKTFDVLNAPWSETITFPQFSIAGQQLDNVTIGYSLFIEVDQSFNYHRAKASANTPAALQVTTANTLGGGLLYNGSTAISFLPVSSSDSASVARKTTKYFDPVFFEGSATLNLSGSDILAFVGTGSIFLTSYANVNSSITYTPSTEPNVAMSTLATGNGVISLTYNFSPIPLPPPIDPGPGPGLPDPDPDPGPGPGPGGPTSVPDAGATGMMLALGFTGMIAFRKKQ